MAPPHRRLQAAGMAGAPPPPHRNRTRPAVQAWGDLGRLQLCPQLCALLAFNLGFLLQLAERVAELPQL